MKYEPSERDAVTAAINDSPIPGGYPQVMGWSEKPLSQVLDEATSFIEETIKLLDDIVRGVRLIVDQHKGLAAVDQRAFQTSIVIETYIEGVEAERALWSRSLNALNHWANAYPMPRGTNRPSARGPQTGARTYNRPVEPDVSDDNPDLDIFKDYLNKDLGTRRFIDWNQNDEEGLTNA